MNQLNMARLDNIRVLSILAVVFLHVSANIVLKTDVNSLDWMIANILDSSVRWAAPVFIILSGYLLLDPSKNTESMWTFYGKRINKLGIAIIFWSAFYLSVEAAKLYIKGIEFSFFDHILYPLYLGRPYFHLWFVYTVSVLYLFTPLFRTLLGHISLKSTVILLMLSFAFAISYNLFIEEKHFFLLESLKYVPYYIAGYLFRFVKFKKSIFISAVIIFILAVFFTAGTTYILSLDQSSLNLSSYSYLSITVVCMSLAVFYVIWYLNPSLKIAKFQSYVFGVYLIHPLFLELFRIIGLKAEKYPPLLSIPIITIVIIYLSFLSVAMIQKSVSLKKITGL